MGVSIHGMAQVRPSECRREGIKKKPLWSSKYSNVACIDIAHEDIECCVGIRNDARTEK
jgi:hypothetical protein